MPTLGRLCSSLLITLEPVMGNGTPVYFLRGLVLKGNDKIIFTPSTYLL